MNFKEIWNASLFLNYRWIIIIKKEENIELYILRRWGKKKKSVSDLHSSREADDPVAKRELWEVSLPVRDILGLNSGTNHFGLNISSSPWFEQETEAPRASVS